MGLISKKKSVSNGIDQETIRFFGIPLLKIIRANNRKKKYFLGIKVRERKIIQPTTVQEIKQESPHEQIMEQLYVNEMMLKAMSANLREFKILENKLMAKFPDLKE